MTIYIVFHSKKVSPFRPCNDGLFAATIAKIANPEAKLIPAVYNEPPNLEINEDDLIYLLDLSYHHSTLKRWIDSGATIQLIDHHKSAKNDLENWLNARFDSVFYMYRSAAFLSWEYFFPDKEVPEIVRYVQDRDIWTKKLPDCDLCSLGLSEELNNKSLDDCVDIVRDALELGTAEKWIELGQSVDLEVKEAIGTAMSRIKWRIIGGYNVPTVVLKFEREFQAYSDIGNLIAAKFPHAYFACVEIGSGFALRSTDNQLDVSKIAKSLGGGGHMRASGCDGDLILKRWKRES
jgi:oligoribonuclease NrnB/cAMP/cGMP phosphodiesterase (DHH superfamily)